MKRTFLALATIVGVTLVSTMSFGPGMIAAPKMNSCEASKAKCHYQCDKTTGVCTYVCEARN